METIKKFKGVIDYEIIFKEDNVIVKGKSEVKLDDILPTMVWSIKQGRYLKEQLPDLEKYLKDDLFYTSVCFETKISYDLLCYVFLDEVEAGKFATLIFDFYYHAFKNLT